MRIGGRKYCSVYYSDQLNKFNYTDLASNQYTVLVSLLNKNNILINCHLAAMLAILGQYKINFP